MFFCLFFYLHSTWKNIQPKKMNLDNSKNASSVHLLQKENQLPVVYDKIIVENQEDQELCINSTDDSPKTPYSSEKVNEYFASRPLAKQKAEEIQYILDKLEIIGRGHSGVVYELPDSKESISSDSASDGNSSRVLKVIRQTSNITINSRKSSDSEDFESSYDMLLKEFRIWTDIMNCENDNDKIVKVYSLRTCWSDSDYFKKMEPTREVGIEAEKMDCTLEKWLKEKVKKGEYNLSLVCLVIKRIITIIKFLHDNHYLHNDIAIRNFLVDKNGTIKISDFGMSRKLRASISQSDHQDAYANIIAADDYDKESSYCDYYLDETQQDQPYWWCAPELLKSLIDNYFNRQDDIRYNKNRVYITIDETSEKEKRSQIFFSKKTDNYMIGCLILELILSRNGKSCSNGVDFIPFSYDCSNSESYPRDLFFLHKELALKMEQCYELKNKVFDLKKHKKFLRDGEFICFKKILKQLLEPKSDDRINDLSVVFKEIERLQEPRKKNFYQSKIIKVLILLIVVFSTTGFFVIKSGYINYWRAKRCHKGKLSLGLSLSGLSLNCKCEQDWFGDKCDHLMWNNTISNSHKVEYTCHLGSKCSNSLSRYIDFYSLRAPQWR